MVKVDGITKSSFTDIDMTSETRDFLDRHGWHLLTAATTIVMCMFTLGMMYQVFISRVTGVEMLEAESKEDRKIIHTELVKYKEKQAESDSTVRIQLSRIESDVSWLKDYFSKHKRLALNCVLENKEN